METTDSPEAELQADEAGHPAVYEGAHGIALSVLYHIHCRRGGVNGNYKTQCTI